jgi:hypothetical protein
MFEMNHVTEPSSASSTISNDEYWIGIDWGKWKVRNGLQKNKKLAYSGSE